MSNNKSYFENKFGFKKNPKVEKSKDSRLEKKIQKQFEGKDKWEHQDAFDASKRKSKSDSPRKYEKREGYSSDKPYEKRERFEGSKRPDGARKYEKREGFSSDKPYEKRERFEGGKRPDGARKYEKREGYSSDKPYEKRERFEGGKRPDGARKYEKREGYSSDKPYEKRERFEGGKRPDGARKYEKREGYSQDRAGSKTYDKKEGFKRTEKPYKAGDSKKTFGGKKEDADKNDKANKFGAKIFAGEKQQKEVFYTEEDRVRLFGEEAFKDRVLKELEEEIVNDLTQEKKEKAFKKKDERREKREKRKGSDDYEITKYIDDEEEQELAYEASGGRKWKVEAAMDNNYRKPVAEGDEMPLNKFIAYCGICSRRDAVSIIKSGKISIDGKVCTEPGIKVTTDMNITMDGKRLTVQKNLVYILMNKPKGYITTTDDPKNRKTVMDLVANHIEERVFPVGRLDRNTTGLLLLTNDGELAQTLAHPKYDIRKIYQVVLDKNLSKADFDKIIAGVELEDGVAPVDHLAYLESKNEIGIEIHSGKNRIVRRIFESCGYVVEKLDRVMYAGLTKKNVPRGKWRLLSKQEVINLKHLGKK